MRHELPARRRGLRRQRQHLDAHEPDRDHRRLRRDGADRERSRRPAAGASVTGTVAVSANATDNDSVAGVQFKLDGANLGAEDTSAPYTIDWDTSTATPGAHTLLGRRPRPLRQQHEPAGVTVTVTGAAADAADRGLRVRRRVGHDRPGLLRQQPQRHGRRRDLDDRQVRRRAELRRHPTSRVDLPALGTFYKTGFTLETWVKKATAKIDVGIVGSWDNGGPMLWIDHIAGRYHQTLASGMANYLDSTRSPALGVWQHLAATYDGTTAKFYVDGALVASKAFSGNVGDSNMWRIGAYGGTPGGFFDGLIDEVRIYDRALTAGQVGADMTTAIRNDTVAPSAPTAFAKTGSTSTSIATSWTASTDNVAVAGYRLYRNGTLVDTVTGTTYTFTGLTCNTSSPLGVEAFDSAGNVSSRTTLTASTAACDTTAPNVALTAPSAGPVSGTVTVSASASDNDSIAGVQFKLDGANLDDEDTTAPYSIDWESSTASPGQHTLTAVARDPSGNTTTSTSVTVTVPQPPPGPRAGRRVLLRRRSGHARSVTSPGNGNQGTIGGAASWKPGKYGSALDFNGTSTRVDLPALGTFYKSAFTLEAWVKRESNDTDDGIVGTWNVAPFGGPMLWLDYPSGRTGLALGTGAANYLNATGGPPVGAWQHVAATYDGTTARLYVDGALVASRAYGANVGDSNVWRIGAYGGAAGDFFDGLIDEVRIYDRVLSAAQIATDMSTALSTRPAVLRHQPGRRRDQDRGGPGDQRVVQPDMLASSITTTTFQLRDAANNVVPATVTYDATTGRATLSPAAALTYGATYTATIKSGAAGVTSAGGATMAADTTWSFTVATRPPILLVDSRGRSRSAAIWQRSSRRRASRATRHSTSRCSARRCSMRLRPGRPRRRRRSRPRR